MKYHLRFSFTPRFAPVKERSELNPNSDLDWHTLSLYPLFQMPGPREQHRKEGGTPGENPSANVSLKKKKLVFIHCNSPSQKSCWQLDTKRPFSPLSRVKALCTSCVSIATTALSTILSISRCKDALSPGRIYQMLLKMRHLSGWWRWKCFPWWSSKCE